MDKELFDIIMHHSKGNLMTALEDKILADMGGTRKAANITANHILDILDAHKEFRGVENECTTVNRHTANSRR